MARGEPDRERCLGPVYEIDQQGTKGDGRNALIVWLLLVAGGAAAFAQDESAEESQEASEPSQAERLAAERLAQLRLMS